MPHPSTLDPERTALVVVDVQEAFRNAIPDFALIASRASMAVRGFTTLGLPFLLTEQYPQGLGPTAEEIRLSLPDGAEAFEKTAFSSCGSDSFLAKLKDLGVSHVILCGIETHICVNQTAHDLLNLDLKVHLLTDCTASRFENDKRAGLAKMQASGVIPSSIEMALFELMKDAKHEHFKEVQNLVK